MGNTCAGDVVFNIVLPLRIPRQTAGKITSNEKNRDGQHAKGCHQGLKTKSQRPVQAADFLQSGCNYLLPVLHISCFPRGIRLRASKLAAALGATPRPARVRGRQGGQRPRPLLAGVMRDQESRAQEQRKHAAVAEPATAACFLVLLHAT